METKYQSNLFSEASNSVRTSKPYLEKNEPINDINHKRNEPSFNVSNAPLSDHY